jgi:Arc/MetJ family transcription regulator
LAGLKYASDHVQVGGGLRGSEMRATIPLDEELVAEAQRLTGLKQKSALVHEALKALIERESARRLARLGSSEPT